MLPMSATPLIVATSGSGPSNTLLSTALTVKLAPEPPMVTLAGSGLASLALAASPLQVKATSTVLPGGTVTSAPLASTSLTV